MAKKKALTYASSEFASELSDRAHRVLDRLKEAGAPVGFNPLILTIITTVLPILANLPCFNRPEAASKTLKQVARKYQKNAKRVHAKLSRSDALALAKASIDEGLSVSAETRVTYAVACAGVQDDDDDE